MAIIPLYTKPPLVPGERPLFALSKEDFEKVRQGYGCPECLEDYNGVYLPQCPLCKHVRRDGEVVQAPEDWEAHVRDLESGYAPPVATNPFSPDEFISRVRRDRNIEQVPLSRLRKKSR